MTDSGPFTIADRRTIVTGGAMGIGYSIAKRFAEAGAHVLLADRDGPAAAGAAKQLADLPGRVVAMTADVSADAPERIVATAVDAFGGVDVLVNNAGIFPSVTALEMDHALFDRVRSKGSKVPLGPRPLVTFDPGSPRAPSG